MVTSNQKISLIHVKVSSAAKSRCNHCKARAFIEFSSKIKKGVLYLEWAVINHRLNDEIASQKTLTEMLFLQSIF